MDWPSRQQGMNKTQALLIVTLATCLPYGVQAASPTFSSDVASIVFQNCTTCHRPNSSAPFSLVTYDDVRKRADTIRAVLDDGYMPPWKPIDHGIEFANDRSLATHEKQTLLDWIDVGCPEGDANETPPPPKFQDGWSLGKPDLIVPMNGQFDVPADGPDIYRSFVFPLNLPENKWVKAVELRPQARSTVHHAIFFLAPERAARAVDGKDGKAGISGMGFLSGFGGGGTQRRGVLGGAGKLLNRFQRNDATDDNNQATPVFNRSLGGYVPGATPNLLPGDLAMTLPLGSDIVMQTHFHPTGKPETEKAELALYFADRPPARPIIPVMVPPVFGFGLKLKVPAGESDYRMSDSFTLPVDTQAIGVSGHAHYICREMQLTATLPDGSSMILLQIDDWDLDWQDQYLFKRPVDLPAGTVLKTELIYDNTADNPENPFHPPQEIGWGRGSNDEMGSVTLLTVPMKDDDSTTLRDATRDYIVASLMNQSSDDMVAMLMQLDNDHDGKLQANEAPPRLNKQIFGLLDTNKDGALESAELKRFVSLFSGLRSVGTNIQQ